MVLYHTAVVFGGTTIGKRVPPPAAAPFLCPSRVIWQWLPTLLRAAQHSQTR